MLYIVGAMAIVFAANFLVTGLLSETGTYKNLYDMLYFDREAILRGEIWRVLSFIFLPPQTDIFFIIFALYFYYIIGAGLESVWGSFRFDLYYFCGILFAIISGFIFGYTDNTYLNLSLFFAFASFYPDYEVRLFFFIPVKVKVLAWLDAILFVIMFILGDLTSRMIILFAVANYFLFFGKTIYEKIVFFFKYKQYKQMWNRFKNKFK